MRDFDGALRRADEGLALCPQSAELHEWKAAAFEGLSQWHQAACELQRAVKLQRFHEYDTLYEACLCLARAGDHEQALMLAKRRKQQIPANVYYLCLAAAHAWNQPHLAREALWQAFQAAHQGSPATELIGVIVDASEAWTGRPQIAREALRKAKCGNGLVWKYRLLLLYQLETEEERQRLGKVIRAMYEDTAYSGSPFLYLDMRDVLDGRTLRMPRGIRMERSGWPS
ncbi:MAG: hypothetical protein ABFD96_14130 [Armatimonadia bacterium]